MNLRSRVLWYGKMCRVLSVPIREEILDEFSLKQYLRGGGQTADVPMPDRSQDATRNRLYVLRGAGKAKGVTAAVSLSAKEFDEMRAARTEVKNARKVVEQAKATERELSAFYAVGKRLLDARQNKRVIAPLFAELQKLVENYENF